MVLNEYIPCLACKKEMPYSSMKIDRIHVKTLTSSLLQLQRDDLINQKQNEYEKKMVAMKSDHAKQLQQVYYNRGDLDENIVSMVKTSKINDLFEKCQEMLNMKTPCCGRLFDIGEAECEAVACQTCNTIFCALCLTGEGCFDKTRAPFPLADHEICPCHNHVSKCEDNQEFKGTYYTAPWYAKCLNDRRFSFWFNGVVDETVVFPPYDPLRPNQAMPPAVVDSMEIIAELKRLLLPLVSKNLKFETDDGISTLDFMGKDYVFFNFLPEQEQIIRQRRQNVHGGAVRGHDGEVEQQQRRRERRPTQCGHCNRVGHNRRRCPQLLAAREEREAELQAEERIRGEEEERVRLEEQNHRNPVINHEMVNFLGAVNWEENMGAAGGNAEAPILIE